MEVVIDSFRVFYYYCYFEHTTTVKKFLSVSKYISAVFFFSENSTKIIQ